MSGRTRILRERLGPWRVGVLLGLVAVALGLWRLVDLPAPWRRDPVWERIHATGVWRVGLDPSFPPFEEVDEAGNIVGFDVDLARAIGDRWGVETTFLSIGYDGLIDAVRSGKIDAAISALPYDPLLTRDVRFSDPYFDAGWVLVVPHDRSWAGEAALDRARVAVEWGSEGDVWARRLRRRHPGMTLVLRTTPDEVLAALRSGAADAAVVDGVVARAHAQEVRVVMRLASEPYVIVVPYPAFRLHANVNAALAALRADGTLARLEERWFGPSGP